MTTTTKRFTVAPTADRAGFAIHDHVRKVAAPFGFHDRATLESHASDLESGRKVPSAWSWRDSAYSDASKPAEPAKAPEFAKGDLVRATKGDEVYTGIVGEVDEGYIGRLEDDIEELHEAGFTFHLVKAAPYALPTAEGYYVRSSNTRATPGDRIYARNSYGKWFALGYSTGRHQFDDDAAVLRSLDGRTLKRVTVAE